MAPKHLRKHETHPPRVKKRKKEKKFRLDSNDFGFICTCVSNVVCKETSDLLELSVTNILPFEHDQKKLFVSREFFETHSVINYGSGWRKDVVNPCLEFGPRYQPQLPFFRCRLLITRAHRPPPHPHSSSPLCHFFFQHSGQLVWYLITSTESYINLFCFFKLYVR